MSTTTNTNDKNALNEQKHNEYRRHGRIITPTYPVEGDFISLNTEQFLVGILLAYMACKAFKTFGILKYFVRMIKRPNTDDESRVTHRKVTESEDEDDGFGIVLDGSDGEDKMD